MLYKCYVKFSRVCACACVHGYLCVCQGMLTCTGILSSCTEWLFDYSLVNTGSKSY